MKPYRRPMVRCQCGTCVADRRADLVGLGFFIFVIFVAAYIGWQILRAVVFHA